MKKILIIILLIVVATFIGQHLVTHGHTTAPEYSKQKICRMETIDFKKTDSPYINNGTYRFIVRISPFKGKELTIHEGKMIDANHGYDYYLNEYGDTVMKEYIDYTNIAKEE